VVHLKVFSADFSLIALNAGRNVYCDPFAGTLSYFIKSALQVILISRTVLLIIFMTESDAICKFPSERERLSMNLSMVERGQKNDCLVSLRQFQTGL
jgi:hypothetical protein